MKLRPPKGEFILYAAQAVMLLLIIVSAGAFFIGGEEEETAAAETGAGAFPVTEVYETEFFTEEETEEYTVETLPPETETEPLRV